MSIAAGSNILWSDITSIYSALNAVQSKFGLTQTGASGGGVGNPATANTMNTLKNQLDSIRGNSIIANNLPTSTYKSVNVGDLITASPWNNLYSFLRNIADNVCAFYCYYCYDCYDCGDSGDYYCGDK